MRQLLFPLFSLPSILLILAAGFSCDEPMKHTVIILIAGLFVGPVAVIAQESPDRVDPPMDCSTPILDGDTPEMKKGILVQAGGDALVRELRKTYADRLAGLFWDQQDGAESRLVLRLTGEEPVAQRRLTVCGEPLIVDFIAGQTHTRDALVKLHSDNLDWFRATFPGLQGTYADERTGEIVLEIYEPEVEGVDVEGLRKTSETRLGVPLRTELTQDKVMLQPALRPAGKN